MFHYFFIGLQYMKSVRVILITHYYDLRLQQDPNIILNMLLWPIVPFASSHHGKRKVNITLFELRFYTLIELPVH